MAHFTVTDNIMFNDCNDGQGQCCALCQYSCKTDEWEACSESCDKDKETTKYYGCLKCKHRPSYIHE